MSRIEWSRVQPDGGSSVPAAIAALAAADSDDEARSAYWSIDNNVVVQGTLYEAAPAAARCLVVALLAAGPASRPWILELLVQLGSGGDRHDGAALAPACREELVPGFVLFADGIHDLDDRTRAASIDLVGLVGLASTQLRGRAIELLLSRREFERDAVLAMLDATLALLSSTPA